MAEGRTLSDIFKKTAPVVSGIHREIFDTARDVTVRIDRERPTLFALVSQGG